MSMTEHARRRPDAPAYVRAGSDEGLSFRALDEGSARLARLLHTRLETGDRFALLMENGPSYFLSAWAARRSGLRCVPVNWHLGLEEAAYIIENSDSRALIASPALRTVAEALAERFPQLSILLSDGAGFGRFAPMAEAIAAQSAEPVAYAQEGSIMFYSSGTTGQPKGILRALSDKPFGEPLDFELLQAGKFGFDEATRFYGPAPLYHAAPLGWAMGAMFLGGTAYIPDRFDAESTLRHIEKHRITHAQFVPTHFVRLLQLPAEVRAKYDVSSLRMVVHAAAPCPVEVKEQMMAWWGPVIYEYYAMSEGAGFTMVEPLEWLAHKGTVGRSVGGPIHVLDEEGRDLPQGEVGQIAFEAGTRFDYHKAPQKTAEFFDARGLARTGDMGWVDPAGYLFLTDRVSHMIISGGVNIYPQEIESVLTLHPAVRDVAVIGVPDTEFGEQVKAVVEPADSARADAALAEELIAYCRERLAGFKCPKTVDFVDDLPRLNTGKLLKRELRKRYWPESRTL